MLTETIETSRSESQGPEAEREAVIHPLHTSCKNCCFAAYQGQTQTGCGMDRLEKFGEAIVEARTLEPDGTESEFYIVNGRVCNTFRDKDSFWAAKHEANPREVVRNEVALKMAVLVYLDETTTPVDIKVTAESLKRQTLQPFQVFFINNQGSIKTGDISALLWKTLESDVTWRITGIVERDGEGRRVSRERALDIATGNLVNPGSAKSACATYYGVFNAGFIVPSTFIANVDSLINDHLDRFRLLTPFSDGSGLVCQIWMHQHPTVGGFAPWHGPDGEVVTDIVKKLTILAESHGTPHIIRSVTDVL